MKGKLHGWHAPGFSLGLEPQPASKRLRIGDGLRFAELRRKGNILLETVVVLALVAGVLPAVLSGISTLSVNSDHAYDRSILFELAQGQMEEVQRQAYQSNAASYTLITAPSGYAVSVTASPAVGYTYPSPSLSATQETVQLVTVQATGVRGNLSISGYKVRR
ncbi:MAG: hypothetical protein HYY32_00295 [Chloroflexi bacterium]|nr:hypothetical protein [Chloroflexota bacterium]